MIVHIRKFSLCTQSTCAIPGCNNQAVDIKMHELHCLKLGRLLYMLDIGNWQLPAHLEIAVLGSEENR